MADRIGTWIPVFGVVVSPALLIGAVLEYRAGASALRVGAGASIVACAVHTLVRELRRACRGPSA
ncbi:hypothetical protein SUDANB6_05571 [Streptomyces sp. enrichment culture]|uniref:hypothetical protein n=1 Tax=Streptomyces sp. enrichment culture TaxID=1795815 RepID=UPI003F5662A8